MTNSAGGNTGTTAGIGLTIALMSLWMNPAAQATTAPGYSESVVYAFTNTNGDGFQPAATLTPGSRGVYFGATDGGASCGGNIFELKPDRTGGFTETPIFAFDCFGKGGAPSGPPILDARGHLYGAAGIGGSSNNGIVYELKRTRTGGYKEVILYTFTGGSDGSFPGPVIADAAGNLYGTTGFGGGSCGCGTVYKLTPGNSGYTLSVLYTFQGGSDGSSPSFPLLLGSNGNLYGTTDFGGPSNTGTVFQLIPNGNAYTETVLYGFQGGTDGERVESGLIADSSGALYGTTGFGGKDGQGVVYKIVPSGQNSTETVLYNFQGGGDGIEPSYTPIMDGNGNLYGVTAQGGISNCGGVDGCGTVYELKLQSSGSYRKHTLYSFATAPDGNTPNGLLFGRGHTLLGTTIYGGSQNCDDGGCGTIVQLAR
ncbi:MAG TPA: choice-of-anchor tandem repeat GloVer-containing protein [Rhizomicrobium sp.]|nr:choice-of-anchor tandem repeat GloVer-containing protein [Rhizomicrobium sp.]